MFVKMVVRLIPSLVLAAAAVLVSMSKPIIAERLHTAAAAAPALGSMHATGLTVQGGAVPTSGAVPTGEAVPTGGAVPTGEAVLRGEAALAEIDYPWQQLLPGWEIELLGDNGVVYGYTFTREQRIEIYVRDGQSRRLLVHVIAHELGHAVDVTLNDADDRRRWQVERGIAGHPWWPGDGATDFATGAGDFAESFAAWQAGAEAFSSELAEPPSGQQMELLAELATS
jgi:hypothetical protein